VRATKRARDSFVASGELNPAKSRVLTQLALMRTTDPKAVQRIFDQYLTLDEYRTQIIESLKARPDIAGARDLLAQTHLVLINSGISARTQTTFWESLNSDLESSQRNPPY
jgi:hypothetical protein